ncbi:ABC type transmembrane transporter of MRP/CFTR family [Komagataella phaffii CBS 7435]|uniref:Bile pigment transporter n=2 Tax=Komagataella phaffii TaxID=460519 RepID=C4QYU4_KOMPG|nr:Bile pigment transporter [Komagataella phaffii GS115]AOA60656.1 GQ67_01584T0 [Komagataella phaffii]CAH2447243.1 ABC type transmembrane transporter of MRP/CFTR family [Komagataella phaffii CBS 7435]AOA66306.1 GQ68_01600T0 [Komagataella phaffii GS115]CAY68418.1 Bile pigment transporter [Komagataella phaffii GS115]CCA37482.1 ABC type transmembrane transporter of MRP/CFTR family [Komagataella phaffii CBS 7435]
MELVQRVDLQLGYNDVTLSKSLLNATVGRCSSYSPLINYESNSLNPCFIGLVVSALSVLVIFVSGLQLVETFLSPKPGSLKSCNGHYWMRINSVLTQGALSLGLAVVSYNLYGIVSDVRTMGYLLSAGSVFFVLLPLHALEPIVHINPRGSLLYYWLVSIPVNFCLFLQQLYGEYPVIRVESNVVSALFLLLLINGTHIFFSELVLWKPTYQVVNYYLENGLDLAIPNALSSITFTWMNPLITKGYKQGYLDTEDLPKVPKFCQSRYSERRLAQEWNKQKKTVKPSLLKSILVSYGLLTMGACAVELSENVLNFLQPWLLRYLIQYFDNYQKYPLVVGFAIAFAMFFITIIQSVLFNQFFILIYQVGISLRAGLMSLIYKKTLVLSNSAKSKHTTGEIVNLMSVDVGRVEDISQHVQTMVSSPLKLVLCLLSLYKLVGNATWSGLLVMFLVIPINTYLIKNLRGYHKRQMQFKDERTRAVNDVLSSIKSIKLYAWEKPMLEKIDHLRNDRELQNLERTGCLAAVVNFAWACVPFFVSCSCFAVFAFTSSIPLTPDIVFPAISLFNILSVPIFSIPALLTALIETSVSLDRLQKFLTSDELMNEFINFDDDPPEVVRGEIVVKNSTFLWSSPSPKSENIDEESNIGDSSQIALKDITFSAKKGTLTCVVGRVGSGKSTFLKAILGQLLTVSADRINPPKISLSGSVAYCSQVPWIMNATVKENILFGHRYDEAFYQQSLEASALVPDLEVLPDGDETLVGEKGVSLSGGQKARLSIARAVYSRADIIILDDILSAVDTHVGKHIMDRVLSKNGLLKTKTRILTTNTIPILYQADSILMIKNGTIFERGDARSIDEKQGEIYTLVNEFAQETGKRLTSNEASETETEYNVDEKAEEFSEGSDENPTLDLDTFSVLSDQVARRASLATLKFPHTTSTPDKRTAQSQETKEKGNVKMAVYKAYIKSCSYSGVALFIGCIFLSTALSVASSYWLKHWSEQNLKNGANLHIIPFIATYTAIGLSSAVLSSLKTVVMWMFCSIRASKSFHSTLTHSVMRSPLSFFETTPIGRIMNRFSTDMNKVDESLPRTFSLFLQTLIKVFFTVAILSFTLPIFIVVVAVLSVFYFYYQQYYMMASRELQRIMSVTRSPIFAHFQETLNGVDTVRAYRQENRFLYLNSETIDRNLKSVYCSRSTNRWLSFRLQLIGSTMVLAAAIMAILSTLTKNPLSSGTVGLIISYALDITSSLSWVIRACVAVETNIVSVERIEEYCRLPSEAPYELPDQKPPPNWPEKGSISFHDYSTRYRENLDPVLKNLNINIQPKDKVGIVGRTGAGKSTLSLAIFRILEASEGYITIDGINISELGLYDLRHSLSIIPQDSQALEGTVRQNLDPLGLYEDEQLWKVLELSHLKAHIEQMETEEDDVVHKGLDAKVSEGGLNLSVGQRQLMCLARALLNSSKILVLDEATAAVDVETDTLIQKTIRSEFKDRTILTIAHRLDTIMDSDKIVVMDKGEIKEFDTPANLLKDTNSLFYQLCLQGNFVQEENTNSGSS